MYDHDVIIFHLSPDLFVLSQEFWGNSKGVLAAILVEQEIAKQVFEKKYIKTKIIVSGG